MIYLRMVGRLGNQMFQYSFARKIQDMTSQKIAIDFQDVLKWNGVDGRAGYENYLRYFNVKEYLDVTGKKYCIIQRFICCILHKIRPRRSADKEKKFYLWIAKHLSKYGIIYFDSSTDIYDFCSVNSKDIYIKGWFESPMYFSDIDDDLRNEFSLKSELSENDKQLYTKLYSGNAICVSVRCWGHQDSGNSEQNSVCTKLYYENAVKFIRAKYPQSILYICSDNIVWCKNNLSFKENVIFEQPNNAAVKLILMTACSHFVISNSTFSWWAQHLSTANNKIVVAPAMWRKNSQSKILYEQSWVCMNEKGDIVKIKYE